MIPQADSSNMCVALHPIHCKPGALASSITIIDALDCCCCCCLYTPPNRCGADVVATDLQQDMCSETMQAIRALGRQVEFVPCDVRDRNSVDAAVKEVEK